jgi:hypothetical protein
LTGLRTWKREAGDVQRQASRGAAAQFDRDGFGDDDDAIEIGKQLEEAKVVEGANRGGVADHDLGQLPPSEVF